MTPTGRVRAPAAPAPPTTATRPGSTGAGGRAEGGFTLVEILVVVIIIGVLAAIAIPVFMNQREKAHRSAATQDMHNAAVAIVGWSSTAGNTLASLDGATESSPLLQSEGLRLGEWTHLTIEVSGTDYCILGRHDQVPDQDLRFLSTVGRVESGPIGSLPCFP